MNDYVPHPALDDIIASGTLPHLYQVRQKLDQVIVRKEAAQTIAYIYQVAASHGAINPNRDTTFSTTSTLYDLEQSTPQPIVVYNKDPNACDQEPLPGQYRGSAGQLDTGSFHTIQKTNQIQLPQSRGTSHQPEKNYGNHADPPATNEPSNSFFCTFCAEECKVTTFKRKDDWKRHERKFHPFGTGLKWRCQSTPCTEVFECEKDIRTHIAQNHPGLKHPPPPTQLKWVYGCGFENCRYITSTWKDRCNHVADHMHGTTSPATWSYSKTIRNLLEDERVSTIWTDVVNGLAPRQVANLAQMQWDPARTGEMRQQLQQLGSCNYGPYLYDLFQNLFSARVSVANAKQIPPTHIDSPSSFTTTTYDGSYKSTPTTPLPYADSVNIQLGQFPAPPNNTHQSNAFNQFNAANQSYQFNHFNQYPSFAHQEVTEADLDTTNPPPTSAYRSSFCMLDAPGYMEPETAFTNQHMTGASPFPNGELADFNNFTALAVSLNNAYPSSDDTRFSMRRLFGKSTERLRTKLHQGAALEHPDLPPDTRMPKPLPRR